MLELLWLIPTLPLAGFVVLAILGDRLSRTIAAWVGVGSVGLSAAVACAVSLAFISSSAADSRFVQILWTWMNAGSFESTVGLYLDPLSVTMMLAVTVVGFLIHLYSVEYMAEDKSFARFFAYMNLFVASMLILVLADNLVLLYLGWEGVGLCSFLLIGFRYEDRVNVKAAIKAFIVTRIGDAAMAVGLFILFLKCGTLDIQDVMGQVAGWETGSIVAVGTAALLLCGAIGKSAQVPLQTWLPDAMAGPTPVSALIHAATMVTAGVYLIARMNVLFEAAPPVMTVVAIIGLITLLLAGFSALVQVELKRVLAYSTISQIGYMFLALGVGAWSAAMFHFVTHACFKSLLFLAAGAVMTCCHHEQNMFRLGGLREKLPTIFVVFLIGAAALSAVPFITSGFFSKEAILQAAWASEYGSPWLWLGGIVGAILTGLYAFRMVFLTFFGEARTDVHREPGSAMIVPLVLLAALSLGIGFIQTPHELGNIHVFSSFVNSVFPSTPEAEIRADLQILLLVGGCVLPLIGIAAAYWLYGGGTELPRRLVSNSMGDAVRRLWFSGWGFDYVYDTLLVRPFVWISEVGRKDVVDAVPEAVAYMFRGSHRALSAAQNGVMARYAVGIGIGAAIAVACLVMT